MSDKNKNACVVFGTLIIQMLTLILNNIDSIASVTL